MPVPHLQTNQTDVPELESWDGDGKKDDASRSHLVLGAAQVGLREFPYLSTLKFSNVFDEGVFGEVDFFVAEDDETVCVDA